LIFPLLANDALFTADISVNWIFSVKLSHKDCCDQTISTSETTNFTYRQQARKT